MEDANPVDSAGPRRRLAKIALAVAAGAVLILFLQTWQGRAIEAELLHELPGADHLLPAAVEVMVWDEADYLHANATFFQPDSLAQLGHTVRLPAGEYRVTYSVVQSFGSVALRLESRVTIADSGRYFVRYELPQNE